jgi:MFS family permease
MFPEDAYPDIGSVHTWQGALILAITCGAQLMDNVFMTAVNLSLPEVQAEFNVSSGDLQWLLSAYTLTFGGFLLFSGVLADRYGRRMIFSIGMFWLSVWTLANGFATSFIQIAIFRALQGIGAAMTVPSAIGIISSYFVASERVVALTFFGASGAIGFCAGLLFGGFVTEALGWRYIFRIAVAVTGPLGLIGCLYLPKDRREGSAKPSLDFLGAALSTSGLILLSFVLSSGGEYGWNKAFIIALLVISVVMLGVFTYVEKKVRNPIMPMSLWKIKNFAPLWITGFGESIPYNKRQC